ncbi:response regulator [Vibrio quintilis]|uniref:Transcriptional regulatory protein n=1 Tax=Vibrio quintilis TaxID=1117707 RepID=A0A1M7YXY6_9VIBR|nr:response regulator [Vibrio quintilis]SHO57413.1 Transcriptional regulatory protein DpiA [Vibrio quintilis]
MTTKTRVMLIEDDIRASYTLESTINQDPRFQVVAVSETCADALMQFKAFQPQLVFVDITLPDGNGLDIIRQLRDQDTDCHFIMTTAERETTTVEKAVQLGVIDYLVKPIRMSRISQALDDYARYKQKLVSASTVDQDDIDQLLRRSPVKTERRTPKGIDSTTLEALKKLLYKEKLHNFSAEDIGERMNFSRVTARRYLEYLESEGILRLILNYNTGGRPRRLYQMIE